MRKDNLKQKIIITGIYLLLPVVIFSGCTKSSITNLESQGKNIICFGDSITVGFGAQEGQDYPTALSKMTRFPVINAGINGDTSSEAVRRIDADALSKDRLLVIIEVGG